MVFRETSFDTRWLFNRLKAMFWASYNIMCTATSASFPSIRVLILVRLPGSTGSSVIQLFQTHRVSATSAAALRIRRACTSLCRKGWCSGCWFGLCHYLQVFRSCIYVLSRSSYFGKVRLQLSGFEEWKAVSCYCSGLKNWNRVFGCVLVY